MIYPKILPTLLRYKKIPFTYSYISSFFSIQEESSDQQKIINYLESLYIETMYVRLSIVHLSEVDLPALVLIENKFVLLTEVSSRGVTYIKANGTLITDEISVFEKKWKGECILIDTSNMRSEPYFSRNKKEDNKNQLTLLFNVFYFIVLILFFSYLFLNQNLIVGSIFVIKLLGIISCIAIFKKTNGVENAFSNLICGNNKKSGCDQVLSSRLSTVLGISISDVGLFYFLSTSVFSILSTEDIVYLDLIKIINLIALPLTILSFGYQWLIVKAWCRLCISVVVLIWLEFIVLFNTSFSYPNTLELNQWLLLAVISLSIIFFFSIFKKNWLKSNNSAFFKKKYFKYRNDKTISNLVVKGGKKLSEGSSILDKFEMGNANSKNRIVIVTSPTCEPCRVLHEEFRNFKKYFEEDISLKLIPYVTSNGQEKDKISNEFFRLILSESENKLDLIDSLFKQASLGSKDFDNKKFDSETSRAKDLVSSWLRNNKINYTPCIIWNDTFVISEFKLGDIRNFLKNEISESN